MKVELNSLNEAIKMIKEAVGDMKNVPGVLFDIADDSLRLQFCDGHRAVDKRIDIVNEEAITTKIVVGYNPLLTALATCQSSAGMRTDTLDITLDTEKGVLDIQARKVVDVYKGENESGEEVYETKVLLKVDQSIKYSDPSSSPMYAILARFNYDDIYSEEERADVWNKAELLGVLDKLSREDAKAVYISSKVKACFVNNRAFTTYILNDTPNLAGFTINSKNARNVIGMLKVFTGDDVLVARHDIDGKAKYFTITDGDHSSGVLCEMAPGNMIDMNTLNGYRIYGDGRPKEYDEYSMVFNRAALMDALNCALASDKAEFTKLVCKVDSNNELDMYINNSTGTSKKNEFKITAEDYSFKDGNDINSLSITMSLRVLLDMLASCDNIYTTISIQDASNAYYIRVEDNIDREHCDMTHYTIAKK